MNEVVADEGTYGEAGRVAALALVAVAIDQVLAEGAHHDGSAHPDARVEREHPAWCDDVVGPDAALELAEGKREAGTRGERKMSGEAVGRVGDEGWLGLAIVDHDELVDPVAGRRALRGRRRRLRRFGR